MQVKVPLIKENLVSLLRRAGYVFQHQTGEEMSFIRSFSRSGYPRFHIYAKLTETEMIFNIHLDRKKETYGSGTRHHGEYDNDGVLAEEIVRLKSMLK